MKEKEISRDPLNRIWKFFASVKLTIFLLLTLAATSIIGTVIPQNEDPEAYMRAFGAVLFRLFTILDLFDMYHSWWFQLLITLLTANIVVCSVDRLSATWKIIFVRNPGFNPERFRKAKNSLHLDDPRSPTDVNAVAEKLVPRSFRYRRTETGDNGFVLYAERWRWTRLGVYIVHSSVVILLIGGLVGSLFGFEGFVNIAEGESTNIVRLRNTGASLPLPFEIRCDDFSVTYYDSGLPKEYRSRLTILENGQPVLQKDIIVNDPLRFRGINIFQSSYGELPPETTKTPIPETVGLAFTSKETGMVYNKSARIGEKVTIPEGLGELTLKAFKDAYDFRGTQLGPVFIGELTQKNAVTVEIVLPLRFPSFDRMSPMFNPERVGDVFISIVGMPTAARDAEKRYYTGLQVTRDPGVAAVYTGFILMIIGCVVTFFMSHQQIYIEAERSGNKTRLLLAGKANRNKLGMQKKVEHLAEKLAKSA
jgi:cytochrome c biogenesis protein